MNKNIKILFALTLSLGAISMAHLDATKRNPENDIALGERPPAVQKVIDEVFEMRKDMEDWEDLNSAYPYNLFFHDNTVLKHLVSKPKKEIYIIDVGSATGEFGKHAMKVLLHDEACQKSEKQFIIFCVTGAMECNEEVLREGNVTLYLLNQFKIENIDEEFLKKGFDLKKQVDLIVSRATLQLLVDPFGTIKRMYSLLTPTCGMILSDSFAFFYQHKLQTFPYNNWKILADTGAVILFRKNANVTWSKYDDTFLLMRNNDQELAIPLEYTDETYPLPLPNFVPVTVLKKKPSEEDQEVVLQQSEDLIHINNSAYNYYYCDIHGKALYESFKAQGLFQCYS